MRRFVAEDPTSSDLIRIDRGSINPWCKQKGHGICCSRRNPILNPIRTYYIQTSRIRAAIDRGEEVYRLPESSAAVGTGRRRSSRVRTGWIWWMLLIASRSAYKAV
jgi:hypothetical protein